MKNPVTVNITRTGKPLSEIRLEFDKAINKALDDIGTQFVERARLNTSIDTEDLRKSMRHQVVKSAVLPRVFVFAGSVGVDYAFKVHEFHTTPAGKDTPAKKGIGPGDRTRAQPSQPEGGAGGKFFQRVAFFRMKEWQLHSAKLVALALGGEDATVSINLSPTT